MSLLHTQEEYICGSQELVFTDDSLVRDKVTYFADVAGICNDVATQHTAATSGPSRPTAQIADENFIDCLMKIEEQDRREWIDEMALIISAKSWDVL